MMNKHCDQCGAELVKGVNASSTRNNTCSDPNSKQLTKCQTAHNAQDMQKTRNAKKGGIQKAAYEKQLEQCRLPQPTNIDQAMRKCLRCEPNEDGSYKTFLSNGKYHRICDECSLGQEGVRKGTMGYKVDAPGSGSKFVDPSEVWADIKT
jgi:hypothetical protein